MYTFLDTNKSLDELELITILLTDVQNVHSEYYTPRMMRLDNRKIARRFMREGIAFLTKGMPRLGKAFDRALTSEVSFDATGFRKETGSKLPKFLGSLFARIFDRDGRVLPTPCVDCIKSIRHILYPFGKYKLPYEQDQEQEVIDQFVRTENEILDVSQRLSFTASAADSNLPLSRQSFDWFGHGRVIREARILLAELFCNFDWRDITPSHGPGAVSTRERYEGKWNWTNVSPRLSQTYPLETYFCTSLGHFCDHLQSFRALKSDESSARVVLVPKDSRGPRLISCEPLDFQWIQQGLSRAIVKHVEHHELTTRRVNFTDQQPNQIGALYGSKNGRYATLDLKEASDRITVGLVRLLFPEPLLEVLMNCRSLSTELPSGEKLNLEKYAPMGSALCFPVLALSIWALLNAGARDAYTRERILVYGDDVIVPTAFAEYAIELLESFGLKINRDKSCIKGFFRESCGVDAFNGVDVTPVRIRTVWSSSRCPHVYASWIAYANSYYDRRYFGTYAYISEHLLRVYGHIPERGSVLTDLSLAEVSAPHRPKIHRTNRALQRRETKVWTVRPTTYECEIDGWMMLLRFFTEGQRPPSRISSERLTQMQPLQEYVPETEHSFAVRQYTKRKQIKLERRWVLAERRTLSKGFSNPMARFDARSA